MNHSQREVVGNSFETIAAVPVAVADDGFDEIDAETVIDCGDDCDGGDGDDGS